MPQPPAPTEEPRPGGAAPPAAAGAALSVLHVAGGYWPRLGGGELLATRVSEGLAARGHAVRVLLVEASGPLAAWQPPGFPEPTGRHGVVLERPPGWRRWSGLEESLKRWPIPGRGELRQWVRGLQARARAHVFDRALDRGRPDVVLLSSNHGLHLTLLAQLRARRSFPLVVVPQMHDEHPDWEREATLGALACASAVAANTADEAQRLVERYGVPREAVVVTGCGTDPPAAPAPWPRAERVLYLGRIDDQKGIDTLLLAMRQVWRARPGARLVVAGARCPSSARVEGWIAALPADERARVDAPRDLTEEAKDALLATARCLVLPSRHESFGIVVAEAWGHGTPVVALDTPVLRATVTSGVDGLLVPLGEGEPARASALAGALERLLAAPDLAQSLGAAGRRAVLERHTWAHVAQRYEQVLATARRRAGAAGGSAPGVLAPGRPGRDEARDGQRVR